MDVRAHLLAGQVIPAHPLALDAARRLDERHQRALTRYYVASGAGGMAVGVHTTQFAIRDPKHALLRPVLELASRTADDALASAPRAFAKIAGISGRTEQAMREAQWARELGYAAGLVSLAAWRDGTEAEMLEHCRALGAVMPLFGFYLQPAVGGRALSYEFWRALAETPELVAIKIAPFDRYATLDVIRAVADAGRADVALYTGNDDNIVGDLTAHFPFTVGTGSDVWAPRIVGGLLGQWAVWTHRAVAMLAEARTACDDPLRLPALATVGAKLTDANGAIFDVRHRFAGCIPGIHEVLRRQGLLAGTWTLDPAEVLSPGQTQEIDRIWMAYPELRDEAFVAEHLDTWLR